MKIIILNTLLNKDVKWATQFINFAKGILKIVNMTRV